MSECQFCVITDEIRSLMAETPGKAADPRAVAAQIIGFYIKGAADATLTAILLKEPPRTPVAVDMCEAHRSDTLKLLTGYTNREVPREPGDEREQAILACKVAFRLFGFDATVKLADGSVIQ